jgi:hypothetical protein
MNLKPGVFCVRKKVKEITAEVVLLNYYTLEKK